MFDEIYVIRPILNCDCGHVFTNIQTKDLDNKLDQLRITEPGQLEYNPFELINVPEKERNQFGHPFIKREYKGWENCPLTIEIEVHAICKKCDKFNSFKLEFENGKLKKYKKEK